MKVVSLKSTTLMIFVALGQSELNAIIMIIMLAGLGNASATFFIYLKEKAWRFQFILIHSFPSARVASF